MNMLFLALSLLLFPYYIFPSGTPQPAHIFMLLFIIGTLAKKKHIKKNDKTIIAIYALFVFYVVIVQLTYVQFTSDSSAFKFLFFYMFNFLFFTSLLLSKIKKDDMIKIIFFTISIGLIIQGLLFFFGLGRGAFRLVMFFNNPNQLSYYALVSISILLVIHFEFKQNKKLHNILFLLATFSGFVLIIGSLSKAAILSSLFILMIYSWKTNKKIALLVLPFFIGIIIYNISYFQDLALIDNAVNRIEGVGTANDDSLEGRGYGRITDNLEYMLFGLGEGGFNRFTHDHELHATFANLLASYGFIGLSLFFLVLFVLYSQTNYWFFIYLISVFAYGITHNGIRSSLIWVLLFVILILLRSKKKSIDKHVVQKEMIYEK